LEPPAVEIPLEDNVTVGSMPANAEQTANFVTVESGEMGESVPEEIPAPQPAPGAADQGSVLERAERTIERLLQTVETLAGAVRQGATPATVDRTESQAGVQASCTLRDFLQLRTPEFRGEKNAAAMPSDGSTR
jgi:hypothetical protein